MLSSRLNAFVTASTTKTVTARSSAGTPVGVSRMPADHSSAAAPACTARRGAAPSTFQSSISPTALTAIAPSAMAIVWP